MPPVEPDEVFVTGAVPPVLPVLPVPPWLVGVESVLFTLKVVTGPGLLYVKGGANFTLVKGGDG